MILTGVDRYRVTEPLFEGIRVILAQTGESYSPAYIQGISGAAFRIGGICPCAPTCCEAMQPTDLAQLLGYQTDAYTLSGAGLDPESRIIEMVSRVKSEVIAGRPVLVWHAFTNAEWDVVCGFDEVRQLFFGRGSYAGLGDLAEAPMTRAKEAVRICPALGALIIGEKTGQYDAEQAERAALEEAVRHAHSELNKAGADGDKWALLEGILCYDRWVRDWRKPAYTRGPGDSYCHSVYRSTHRAAAGFVTELAGKYPSAGKLLNSAAIHFQCEADALDQCEPLLGWRSPKGPDPDRNEQVATLLGQARDSYARAMAELAAALSIL
jgi:hypothetical protein